MRFFARLKSHVPVLLILCILAVGSYLRLYRISEYMTFLGDEGRDMLVVLRMIVNHKWTLLGPTASVGGFFLGPIYYYFMVPFVWLFGMDPSGAAVMVALFGIATVYLLYRFVSEMFDPWTGVITASLYAVSPLIIAYSRSSWNPNPVPFFATALLYVLWKSTVDKNPVLLFWAGLAIGIGLQLHYLFLFLAAVTVFWLLCCMKPKVWFSGFGWLLFGGLIGYAPFLAFEVRHGFPNTISIVRFLSEGKDTGFVWQSFLSTISDVSYRLVGRVLFRLPPPEQWVNLMPWQKNVWNTAIGATIISFIAGSLVGITTGKKRSKSWFGILILLFWTVIPLLLFGLYRKGIYDYYFSIFFPVPCIGAALLLRLLFRRPIGAVIGTVLLTTLLYWNWLGRPGIVPPNNQLGQMKSIAAEALSKTDGKPFNFALMTGGNSDHAYRYFFEAWGRAPITIENESVDPDRKTVTDQLIVVCELSDCKPLGASLWEIAGFGRAEIVGEWHISFVTIYKLVHYQEKQT